MYVFGSRAGVLVLGYFESDWCVWFLERMKYTRDCSVTRQFLLLFLFYYYVCVCVYIYIYRVLLKLGGCKNEYIIYIYTHFCITLI